MLRILILLLFSIPVKGQTVYKTPSGARYHVSNCSTVKNVSEKITAAEAIKEGLTSCKVCKPINIYQTLPLKKVQGEQKKTKQCIGLTKSGNRCKHMTAIGNGYCYQHQPD